MTLGDLNGIAGLDTSEYAGVEVNAITEDSRAVQTRSIFVALKGERSDGHDFITDAEKHGAIAIIGEKPATEVTAAVPYFQCPKPREALATIAHRLAGDPTRHLTVIGVTGTNGKTSTVFVTWHVLQCAGVPAARFGTLGYVLGGDEVPAAHTTPFGGELASLFARARDRNIRHVVMEASSHALDQGRVGGIQFTGAVFTNLSQDHLDYHRDMKQYLESKLRLFESLPPSGFAVINRDSPEFDTVSDVSPAEVISFGRNGDCRAARVSIQDNRTRFFLETPWGTEDVSIRLLGWHNVSNVLAAVAVAARLGVPLPQIATALAGAPNVPGRFEMIDEGQDFRVVVDYAHTEDGLRNVLEAARSIANRRLIVVFGCGGDRDRTKRPKMAAAVAERADYAIITSDNPRTEDPRRILDDVEAGIREAGFDPADDYEVIEDRRQAITQAIELAETDDLVLIAGKGHEDYQIIGAQRLPFDDRTVARELLGVMA